MNNYHSLRCWAEIDNGALINNWQKISNFLPSQVHLLAIVKANAYGLGVKSVVKNCKHLDAISLYGVANIEEGLEVRSIDPEKPILILGSVLPEEYPALTEGNLNTIVSSLEEVSQLNAFGEKNQRIIGIHLKVDTGNGRMGVWFENIGSLYKEIEKSPFLRLKGICTHFSSSPTDPEFTHLQRSRLISAIGSLSNINLHQLLIHCDNSAGLSSFDQSGLFNCCRIGILQYGILPGNLEPLSALDLKPVLSLHCRISLIKELPQGESVSYGRLHFLKEKTKVGIITAGYNDCIPIPMTNRGEVLVRGKRCPMIGRVAMDQVVVDLNELTEVSVGDKVTLIGSQENQTISIEEFSKNGQTIPWQVLTSLGNRVKRISVNLNKATSLELTAAR